MNTNFKNDDKKDDKIWSKKLFIVFFIMASISVLALVFSSSISWSPAIAGAVVTVGIVVLLFVTFAIKS